MKKLKTLIDRDLEYADSADILLFLFVSHLLLSVVIVIASIAFETKMIFKLFGGFILIEAVIIFLFVLWRIAVKLMEND